MLDLDLNATTDMPAAMLPQPDEARSAIPRLDPAWTDALVATQVFAAAPALMGGIHVIARASPVRDRWLEAASAALSPRHAVKRITPAVTVDRLTGGIDIGATLASGAPVRQSGLLETLGDDVLLIAMAERLSPHLAGIIARALETPSAEGFGLIAFDESDGEEDHQVPIAITDRLGLRVRLDGISIHAAQWDNMAVDRPDRSTIDAIALPDEALQAIIGVCGALRGPSLRAPLQAMAATRIITAIDGCDEVGTDHIATALRLTCGAMIAQPDERDDEQAPDPGETDDAPPNSQRDQPNGGDTDDPSDSEQMPFDPQMLNDMIIAAAKGAKLDLEAMHTAAMTRTRADTAAGKSGAVRQGASRGRPSGLVARPPYPGARPNVVATLRTAAPWQVIRRAARGLPRWQPGEPLDVRPSDFRYIRYAHNTESAAIFAVDASGSTALDRLGEAKGCIELLLADCYVRRDSVALVAFRGDEAEVVLEPTRSLVRAKRSLTALPGGGPTPLASGMKAAVELAIRTKRKGQSPLIVMLTDGKGNVALDGTQDRGKARQDAEAIAKLAAAHALRSVIIDIARRPRDAAKSLAQTMGADYVTLPRADAGAMSAVVAGYMQEGRQ